MFITDRFVYVHLQKTGGSRIREILATLTGGSDEGRRRHGYLEQKPADKLVFGSIRNPYEWYVSLWAFGCGGRGGVLSWLKDDPDWQRVYTDVNNPQLFRKWLKMVYSEKYSSQMQNGYNQFSLRPKVGLMSWRYAYLYLSGVGIDKCPYFADYDSFFDYACQHNMVDYWLRLEDLPNTLGEALTAAGYKVSRKRLGDLCRVKSNTSRHYPHRIYYDLDSLVTVRDRERLIMERFGYE